jgi:glycosyltransferase involved in cell wall biosynthesis
VVTLFKNIFIIGRLSAGVDVIHFQKCFHWVSIPALVAGYLLGKKLHYDWDDWEEQIYIASHQRPQCFVVWFLKTFERWLPRLVDTVSVASDHLRKLCLGWGVPPSAMVKAPVGADLVAFRPDVSGREIREKMGLTGPVVLYLGQLHSAQYAHLFLEAARQVAARVPQATFLIVGEGARRRELEDLNARLEPAPVVFTGYVEHKDIPGHVAAADVCVAPFEDNEITRCKSPLKIVEYMAAGKPVVASDVGEVRWMLDAAGVIVPPGDIEALAKGIVALLQDAPRRARLGALARRRAEEIFNWGRTAQGIAAAYSRGEGQVGPERP